MDSLGDSDLRSSYSLFGSKGAGVGRTKMTHRGRKDVYVVTPVHNRASQGTSERDMTRLENEVLHRMKIFMARESSNGENFIQPLKQIRDALER